MEKISFEADGVVEELYVLADTKLYGETYILVTDQEDGDSDAWIFKQVEDGEEAAFEIVEDEELLEALSKLFEADLEDIEIS